MLNKVGATGLLLVVISSIWLAQQSTQEYISLVINPRYIFLADVLLLIISTILAFNGHSTWNINEDDEDISSEERRQYYVNKSNWNLDSHRLGGIGESYYP